VGCRAGFIGAVAEITREEAMQEIRGEAKTIRQLLGGTRYTIDYYQREYQWQATRVLELLEDLAAKRLDDYTPSDRREAVGGYGRYFLGSVIVSPKHNQRHLVDG
jgi:uncharacterized protein with ParB-like and HNH nuclease domain